MFRVQKIPVRLAIAIRRLFFSSLVPRLSSPGLLSGDLPNCFEFAAAAKTICPSFEICEDFLPRIRG